ncbi:MAG: ATP-binding cassette domain-containing protein [Streptosporangiaceae bacterium]
MIEIDGLTKRYGDKTAVDGLSFVVEPGLVTGFLGPNGAGKSTTMRVIAGLDRPTSGTVRVNGKHYPDCAAPMGELGILLDARSVHPGLSARNNLLALARTAGIGRRRVDEVIELAGLAEVAGARSGGFSLGMGQRLGVAAALLGQPQTVVLDEPVNGLDPDGVRWIRLLLRSLADEGRTVFVSSHLMSEMAQTATRLVIVGRGQLIAETCGDDRPGGRDGGRRTGRQLTLARAGFPGRGECDHPAVDRLLPSECDHPAVDRLLPSECDHPAVGISRHSPPLRLRLLPWAWPGALSPT